VIPGLEQQHFGSDAGLRASPIVWKISLGKSKDLASCKNF
jgi:hypothetical protein